MKLVIALLSLLLTLSSALKESVSIYRSYHLKNSEGPNKLKVGQILLSKQDKRLSAQLSILFETLIESSALVNSNDYVILTYVKGDQSYRYIINYDDVLANNYKETINVVVNQNGDILGFNYFQEKLKKKEYRSSNVVVVRPEQGKEHIFAYSATSTKAKGAEAEEEQSFFSKYKWYLIGFGAVVMIISNMDPEKMGAMAQQQAQR